MSVAAPQECNMLLNADDGRTAQSVLKTMIKTTVVAGNRLIFLSRRPDPRDHISRCSFWSGHQPDPGHGGFDEHQSATEAGYSRATPAIILVGWSRFARVGLHFGNVLPVLPPSQFSMPATGNHRQHRHGTAWPATATWRDWFHPSSANGRPSRGFSFRLEARRLRRSA